MDKATRWMECEWSPEEAIENWRLQDALEEWTFKGMIDRQRTDYVYPEPLPYPSTKGIKVEYLDINVVPTETWVPACGGTEQVFIVDGVRWQYVWCVELGKHGYYNLDTDVVTTDPGFYPCNRT